jgi:hypothetical protein
MLAEAEEVRIAATRRSGELGRPKIIWIVVDGDHAYVRSVRGADGAWYKAAVASGSGTLQLGKAKWSVQLTPVSDAGVIERVSEALRRKYQSKHEKPTAAMLRDEVLSATLRVDPA